MKPFERVLFRDFLHRLKGVGIDGGFTYRVYRGAHKRKNPVRVENISDRTLYTVDYRGLPNTHCLTYPDSLPNKTEVKGVELRKTIKGYHLHVILKEFTPAELRRRRREGWRW